MREPRRRLVFVLLAGVLSGCVEAPRLPSRPTRVETLLEAHLRDDGMVHAPPGVAADDRTVQLYTPGAACTGALIAADLVLTARHCVVAVEGGLMKAVDVRVAFGPVDAPWGSVAARALAEGDCGSDVALVSLAQPVVGLTPFSVRRFAAPREDERVEATGYGRCGKGEGLAPRRSIFHGVRSRIDPHGLVVRIACCPGDSGSPIVAVGTDEIVGVVSAVWQSRHWPAGVVERTFGERVDDLPAMFERGERSAAQLMEEGAACEERRVVRRSFALAPDAPRTCFDGWCEETVN